MNGPLPADSNANPFDIQLQALRIGSSPILGTLITSILILALTSCRTITPDAEGSLTPQAVCEAAAASYGSEFAVVAAFTTTVSAVRNFGPLESEPVLWPDLDGNDHATLCFLDGELAKAPPPSADSGEPTRPFDRSIVAVADTRQSLIQAGYHESLPIREP